MVRVDSANKALCKPSVQADPPDLFADFPSFLDNSFPDFDSIEGWILDQDFGSMPTDETSTGAPQKLIFPETDELVEHGEVGAVPECCLEGGAGLKEPVQVTVGGFNGEIACEISVDTLVTVGPQLGTSAELELSGNIELSSDSIAQEMEKVKLVANSGGTFGNAGIQCEETSMEDVGLSRMTVTVNAEGSPRNGGKCTGSLNTGTADLDTPVGNEIEIENAKLENGNEGCDSGTSESDSNEESSSTSSSDETDDDDDDEEDCSSDDEIEVEEGEIRDADKEEAIIGSDDEEEVVVQGPIKSKNEVEVNRVRFHECFIEFIIFYAVV